jgi:Ca2+-transporting ATPase
LLRLFLEQFEDRLVQILLVIATVSAVFSFFEVQQQHASPVDVSAEAVSLWKFFVEPAVILLILLLNAVVGVWQSASASDSLEALRTLQPALATVVRGESDGDGESHGGGGPQQQQVLAGYPASQLVPGDVIHVRVGDKIPADARLVSSSTGGTLQVDESSLTGESVTVQKLAGEEGTLDRPGLPIQDQSGMLYAGTLVTRGSGVAVVTHTGMASQMGRISQGVTDAAADAPKTPLERKLDEFSSTLTVIIGVICLAVWIISIPKFNDAVFPGGFWEGAVYYAKVAVALGVAAIPEGLPAVITLCLSLGTRRMAERNVIVRKLASVETLGCTSVICTDKVRILGTGSQESGVCAAMPQRTRASPNSFELTRRLASLIVSFSFYDRRGRSPPTR